jgi:hypothetical protein
MCRAVRFYEAHFLYALPRVFQRGINLRRDKGQAWRGYPQQDRGIQTNDLLLKVLCHNICVVIRSIHEHGIESTL